MLVLLIIETATLPRRKDMPTKTRATWLFSLSMKLLAMLIPVTAASMFVAMVGLDTFLQDFFRHRAELETEQVGVTVKSALRQSMLKRPELLISNTLADIQKTPNIRRVWIIDKSGRVAHASDPEMIGKVLDKVQSPMCTVCHSTVVTPEARRTLPSFDNEITSVSYIARLGHP